jgi:GT2 family glycosyltransferase
MIKKSYPRVKIIENKKNIGFGAANNRGLDNAIGKYVFYLNSDTVLLNNSVKIFFDYWENYGDKARLGALGCNLYDRDMDITFSGEDFPSFIKSLKKYSSLFVKLSVKALLLLFHIDYTAARPPKTISRKITGETGFISGADLFMLNDNSARFDERFFLYYEDTDLQYRLSEKGKKRIIIDGPRIQHLSGGSNNIKDNFEMYASFSVLQSFVSCLIYYYKQGKKETWMLKLLMILILCNPLLAKKTYPYINKILHLNYHNGKENGRM